MDDYGYDYEDLSCPVYYRVMYWPKIDKVTVVEMQDFDEYDYDQENFYKDECGVAYKFEIEEDARRFINEKFVPEYIDPEYLDDSFWRKMER